MNRAVNLGLCLLAAPAVLAVSLFAENSRAADAAPAPATQPAASGGTWRVTDHGAVGDGKTSCTAAINAAIAACNAAGGGRVVVPPGTYLTGPIELRSNVNLHVEPGATVLFSRNFEDFPIVQVIYEGRLEARCRSPLWGEHLKNVSITGPGAFDGQGDAWRWVKKSKLSTEQWDALVKSGGVVDPKTETWYPSEVVRDGQPEWQKLRDTDDVPRVEDYAKFRPLLRPVMVHLRECEKVLIDGPTFRNSPNWNVHLLLCENVTVRNATIWNPEYAQNGDGLDLDSCRNVMVAHTNVNAGDDAICIKSGRDEEGRKRGWATENVTITDCVVGTGHGGVVIGSEMSGGAWNITVNNCIFKGTDIGLRFKTTRGRGGVVENISVTNVTMEDIKGPAILFDMYYMTKQPKPEPVSERTPHFRQFHIRNVTCEGAQKAMTIRGLPELPIEGITLEGVRIESDLGGEIVDAKDIILRDVQIEARTGPALQLQRVENLTTERLSAAAPGELPVVKAAPTTKPK